MTMRQNNWTLGAYCAAYCTLFTQHHGLEDRAVFPHLRRADPGLIPVIDRLEQEHVIIHEVVDGVDRALVNLVATPDNFTQLQEAVDALTDALRSHLAYEEQQITEPLSRFGFFLARSRGMVRAAGQRCRLARRPGPVSFCLPRGQARRTGRRGRCSRRPGTRR